MNAEEKRDYNRLPKEAREYYDYQKSKHPSWTHVQLMNRVGVEMQIGDFFDKGKNINTRDPGFWKDLIQRVDGWFRLNFSDLYLKVKDTFRRVTDELTGMIVKGVQIVGDFLERLFNFFN